MFDSILKQATYAAQQASAVALKQATDAALKQAWAGLDGSRLITPIIFHPDLYQDEIDAAPVKNPIGFRLPQR